MLPVSKVIQTSSVGCKAGLVSGTAVRGSRSIWQHPVRPLVCYGNRYTHSESHTERSYSEGETAPHYHRKHQPSSDSFESDNFNKEFDSRVPSNKAKSALSEAFQHSGADSKHPKRPAKDNMSEDEKHVKEEKDEDVRKHNEDMEKRYDRAFNQITQEGELKPLSSDMDERGRDDER